MTPEEGKRYYLRYGGVSGVLRKNWGSSSVWTDGLFTWLADGSRWHNEESRADLIREYIDPQPLEWKRGIPTEEECRECWIVTGGCGVTPHGLGSAYLPRSLDKDIIKITEEGWYLALCIKPVEPQKPKTKTQSQYSSKTGEELWTDSGVVSVEYWTPTGLTREVPA